MEKSSLRNTGIFWRCLVVVDHFKGIGRANFGPGCTLWRTVTAVGLQRIPIIVAHGEHGCRDAIEIAAKVLLVAFVVAAAAKAAPPPGTDLGGSAHQWFEQQHNVRGQLCCDVSDGYLLDEKDVRIKGSGYEVRIEDVWYPVRPSEMRDPVRGGPNPTGHPIVWYTRSITRLPGVVITCFAPGNLF